MLEDVKCIWDRVNWSDMVHMGWCGVSRLNQGTWNGFGKSHKGLWFQGLDRRLWFWCITHDILRMDMSEWGYFFIYSWHYLASMKNWKQLWKEKESLYAHCVAIGPHLLEVTSWVKNHFWQGCIITIWRNKVLSISKKSKLSLLLSGAQTWAVEALQ